MPAHFIITACFLLLFLPTPQSRRLSYALLPFVLFAISYDWMRVCPNYMVNPIDVQPLYETEKAIFGIPSEAGTLTPNEYFLQHHWPLLDFMSGLFYLCWVPVPLAFCIGLFLVGKRRLSLRFSIAFLLANWLGFAGYYIHPAAPPWYVMHHGFEPVLDTMGEVAGLGRFDDLVGVGIFHSIYCHSSNVFAALPSLHSAYVPVAFLYALIGGCRRWVKWLLAIVSMGIWWSAVYTSHHYVIDVILGIFTAGLAVALLEKFLLRWSMTKKPLEHLLSLVE
ncbi:MAG: phosphatase PAP2 family protein [Bacteroidaceae bacterium]|nr:phosphatase PAP2 family protein [Bacteroidaceae bacterium]